MKKLMIIFICFALYACASSIKPLKYSEEEKRQAYYSIMNCLVGQTTILDDGSSDAMTIARAITQACYEKFEIYTAMDAERLEGNKFQHDFIENERRSYIKTSLDTVLRLRTKKTKLK